MELIYIEVKSPVEEEEKHGQSASLLNLLEHPSLMPAAHKQDRFSGEYPNRGHNISPVRNETSAESNEANQQNDNNPHPNHKH